MPSASPSVLIAEDNRSLARLYTQWLNDEYTVHTAFDGHDALQQLSPEIDCVLLDRNMPELSGDVVLERIREQELQCRVAMVTAVEPDFEVLEMGFDDYVVKPTSRTELQALVEELITLNEYDSLLQEYFQLVSTKAALHQTKTEAELADSDEYQALLEDIDRVQKKLDTNAQRLFGNGNLDEGFPRL